VVPPTHEALTDGIQDGHAESMFDAIGCGGRTWQRDDYAGG